MARVLLVEDDPAIRTSLARALEHDGHHVLEREHGAHLDRDEVDELASVDLAIVDVSLPTGPDGVELSRTLTSRHGILVIILTAQDDLEAKGAGYRAGADLYVTKPFSVTELLWQVGALLRRSRQREVVLTAGKLTLDPVQRIASHGDHQLPLSPTEFDLLAVLVRHPGQVLTKPRLLELVWGHAAYDPNVVETTIRRLRTKLDPHGPDPIETVRGAGYRLRG